MSEKGLSGESVSESSGRAIPQSGFTITPTVLACNVFSDTILQAMIQYLWNVVNSVVLIVVIFLVVMLVVGQILHVHV